MGKVNLLCKKTKMQKILSSCSLPSLVWKANISQSVKGMCVVLLKCA